MQQKASRAGGKRAEQRVVQPVRPARVCGVPEHVVLSDVEAELLVGMERRERAHRNRHALGCPRGATGEQLHHRCVAADCLSSALRVFGILSCDKCIEVQLVTGRAARDDDLPRCVGGDVLSRRELLELIGVGNDHLRAAGRQAESDGRRSERREQGHVDCSAAPDSEERDHQVRRLTHQGRDVVTRLDSEVGQSCRETRRLLT